MSHLHPSRPHAVLGALALVCCLILTACQVVSPLPDAPVSDEDTVAAPVTLFPDGAQPAQASHADANAVEVGTRFTSDTDGWVTGMRFYKGSSNTGTHIGNVWSADGTNRGRVTFTGETASGWQHAEFATPVRVRAGRSYVVSYFAPNGRYAATSGYFSNQPTVSGPLTAPRHTSTAPNGVYRYGQSTGFPSSTYGATNYWVDVVFQADATTPTTTTPPTTTAPTVPPTTTAPTVPPTTVLPPPPGVDGIPAGFPNSTTTGVPPGTTLARINGDLNITADYARNNLQGAGTAANPYVFENKLVTGMLQISVPHVLVRNCRVHGGPWYGIWSPANNVTVQDCEVGPDGTGGIDYGVSFENHGTARRVHVHNTRVGIKVRSNGLIEDSYIHSLYQTPGSHNGAINSPDGNNGVVRGNTVVGNTVPHDGRNHNGVSIYTTWGPSTNWLIEGNYFDHNGYHVFGAVTAPFVVRNNVMTDDYERTPNLKWYYHNTLPGMTAHGNVNENGRAID